MFQFKHYVPILKGKMGEFGALQHLAVEVKDALSPFIDVPRVPLDFPSRTPKYPLEAHLKKIAGKIKSSWGKSRPFFI